MELEFLKNILSVPNPSGHEELLAEAIMNWCSVSGVKCKKDGKGNLYLTKGSAGPGHFYPGMTAHLDSVIGRADGMMSEVMKAVEDKRLLEIVDEGGKIHARLDGKDVVTGCDDKNAIAIVLSMFQRLPKLKAAFYVEEEVGMNGSSSSDFSFWDDVCWVLGFDSPGGNRATHSSSGTILYSDEFFDKYIEPACSKHGVTSFNHEPYTDIKLIREKTGLETFNCRNGGIGAHSTHEYADFKTVCDSEELAYDLLTSVPTDTRHVSDVSNYEPPRSYFGGSSSYGSSGMSDWLKKYMASKTSDKKHGEDAMCAISLDPDSAEKTVEFMERIDKINLPVDLEPENISGVSVYGELRAVKRAYSIFWDIVNGTKYGSFAELGRHEKLDEFWDCVEFDDEDENTSAEKSYEDIFGTSKKAEEPEDVEFEIKPPTQKADPKKSKFKNAEFDLEDDD